MAVAVRHREIERLTQPQEFAPVNWGDPITDGLITVIRSDTDGNYRDLVGANHGAASASLAQSSNPLFSGRRFPGTAYIDLGNHASLYPTEFTLLSVFAVDNSNPGWNQDLFSTHWSQTGYVLGIGGGSLNFLIGTAGGWQTAALSIANGVPYAAVATSSASSKVMSLYVDSRTAVNSHGGTYQNGTAQRGYVGASQVYNNYTTGVIALTALWARVLTETEARSLASNPWRLFGGERIASPYSIGIPGVPVLSVATMASITSSGGVPRVTLTF